MTKTWTEHYADIGLAGRLSQMGFWNWRHRDDWPKSGDIELTCFEYLQHLESGAPNNWLLFTGAYGTGKTHLAAALVKTMAQEGKDAYFVPWADYLEELKTNWESRATKFKAADFLALDDVDKYKPSDWSKALLYQILNHRYNRGTPTLLTTNQPVNRLERYVGGALYSRLIEAVWRVVTFDGPDYRKR